MKNRSEKSQYRTSILTLLALLVLAAPANPLLAGKAPYSPEQLKTLSAVIATGTIIAIEHRTIAESSGALTIRWSATLRPDKIEKGTVPSGDLKMSYLTSGDGPVMVMCGPAQYPVPAIGDRVRAHAELKVAFEQQEVFPLLAPNGWEILDTSGQTGEKPINLDGLVNPRSTMGAAGATLVALLMFILWRVFRKR
ncbi:MAG: hypothetical protein AAEJ04_08245 [Planctomycetota bacterium]